MNIVDSLWLFAGLYVAAVLLAIADFGYIAGALMCTGIGVLVMLRDE